MSIDNRKLEELFAAVQDGDIDHCRRIIITCNPEERKALLETEIESVGMSVREYARKLEGIMHEQDDKDTFSRIAEYFDDIALEHGLQKSDRNSRIGYCSTTSRSK